MDNSSSIVKTSESNLQSTIVQYLQLNGYTFFSIPNEGHGGNPRRAMHLKSMGQKNGVADLCVFHPHGTVTFLEVKADGGKQSHAQRDFEAACRDHGVAYHVVRSVYDVAAVLG